VATVCQRVIVLDRGRIRFEGEPMALADMARGRVWTSPARADGALAAWRTSNGHYHNIGDPPAGARLADPSIEDGYLMLLDTASLAGRTG